MSEKTVAECRKILKKHGALYMHYKAPMYYPKKLLGWQLIIGEAWIGPPVVTYLGDTVEDTTKNRRKMINAATQWAEQRLQKVKP